MAANEQLPYRLPAAIISPGDLGKLVREAEAVVNFLEQAALRQPGQPTQLPRTGKLLQDTLELNNLNVLQKNDRDSLMLVLNYWQTNAPSVHMSFSTDPSAKFLLKLVAWLRQEINPYLLVRIGIQPGIGAGCTLRTTNKYFDFSLRERLNQHKHLLTNAILQSGTAALRENADG